MKVKKFLKKINQRFGMNFFNDEYNEVESLRKCIRDFARKSNEVRKKMTKNGLTEEEKVSLYEELSLYKYHIKKGRKVLFKKLLKDHLKSDK